MHLRDATKASALDASQNAGASYHGVELRLSRIREAQVIGSDPEFGTMVRLVGTGAHSPYVYALPSR